MHCTEPRDLKTEPKHSHALETAGSDAGQCGVQKALKLSPTQQVQLCKVHLMVQKDLQQLKQRRGDALAALTVSPCTRCSHLISFSHLFAFSDDSYLHAEGPAAAQAAAWGRPGSPHGQPLCCEIRFSTSMHTLCSTTRNYYYPEIQRRTPYNLEQLKQRLGNALAALTVSL